LRGLFDAIKGGSLIVSEQQACVIFNKLVVNSIEDTSGIFIGTNQAVAWSSYSKNNQGFGSLQDCKVTNSINVVHDPDVLDATVKDVRNIAITEIPNHLQQCAIDFHSIHANSVSNGSAIDLGDIKQLGWRSSRKVNYGGGKYQGGSRLSRIANITVDNDVVDAKFDATGQSADTSGTVKNVRITQNTEES
jgi:hypothetical protein